MGLATMLEPAWWAGWQACEPGRAAPDPCGRDSRNQVQTAALTRPAQASHHRRKSQEKDGVELRQDRTQEAVTEIFHFLMA